MGKKQRAKQERKQAGNKKSHKTERSGSPWIGWVIGLVIFLGLAIAGIVLVVQMNKDKLVKFTVGAMTNKIHQELTREQGRFSIDDSKRIRAVLERIDALTGHAQMDAQIGGHFSFILKVVEEIVKQGNLNPGELDKLEGLIGQGEQLLKNKANKKSD